MKMISVTKSEIEENQAGPLLRISVNTGEAKSYKTHSGELSQCNLCAFATSEASNFWSHLRTHSGEKVNKCNQCDYASSRADHLRAHLKTHSGEKSNKCNQCDYASSEAGNLRKHLKTHSGEKSNKCNQSSHNESFHVFESE